MHTDDIDQSISRVYAVAGKIEADKIGQPSSRPLQGVRVIEFCQVAAGPFCCLLLADLGADVIKVEPPQGDSLRTWPPLTDGFSENFASLNRNKRSIILDLKTECGLSAARALCISADVIVENNRPGVMSRLGLGYEEIARENPRILYCSISAYGQEGPRAAEGGFDAVMQAVAGVMSVTGERDGAPVKCGVPICDFSGGLYAAFAIVSVLHQVREDNRGHHIDISLLGSTLGISALQTSEYFGTGQAPRRLGSAHPRNAPYESFRAMDGPFVLAAGTDRLWKMVCDIIDRSELTSDARFCTIADRAANQSELKKILEAVFATKTVESWVSAFIRSGVPAAPINDYPSILADPQIAAMGWIQDLQLPNGEMTKTFGSPIRIDGAAVPIRRGPPALGGDAEQIINDLRQGRSTNGAREIRS